LLLVDDDPDQLELTSSVLQRAGHRVRTCLSPVEALRQLDGVALVVTDLQMPEMNGVVLCERIKALAPHVVVIVATAAGLDESGPAVRAGAFDFLLKPIDPKLLLSAVRQALQRARRDDPTTSTTDLARPRILT
jgi:DNA-binding NtrC family response regulator